MSHRHFIYSLTSRYNYFRVTSCYKNYGDFVKVGDTICFIKCYNDEKWSSAGFNVVSLEEGYLYLTFPLPLNSAKLKRIDYPVLYKIYKNPNQDEIKMMKKKRFLNFPLIEMDKFTNKKIIRWQSILGQNLPQIYYYGRFIDCAELISTDYTETLWFTFENNNDQDFLITRYKYKDFRLSTGSKIYFLFDDSEILELTVKEKPYEHSKGYDNNRQIVFYEAKIPVSFDKLEVFKNKPLTGWRIEIGRTGKTITGLLKDSDRQFGIMNFVSDYMELVQKETSTKQQTTQPNAKNRRDYISYKFPETNILNQYEKTDKVFEENYIENNKTHIINVLKDFDIEIDTITAAKGPTVTLFELIPAKGVRISKIKSLEEDISLALSALGIRIIAPMPGKGTIGIEVPNKKPQIVSLKSVVDSEKFRNLGFDLPIALGKTIDNKPFVIDLAKMPHLLIAGATGQGKSVGLNVIITSLLFSKYPGELFFVLIDPKKVEFSVFNAITDYYLYKHPRMKNAILTETEQIIKMLDLLCKKMDNRFKILVNAKVKNIQEYNRKVKTGELPNDLGLNGIMPHIVVIIDEFADLILIGKGDVERPITRLAQLARAVGIHLVVATQRPSVNIITGVIKANFPARISYRVASRVDSRTILDYSGAEKLIGRGDMLFSEGSNLTRLQSPYVASEEIEKIIAHILDQFNLQQSQ